MSRLEDTVEMLMQHADPSGDNHRRLLHIKGMMARNVMVGPNLRSFVAGLVEKMDKIECEHMRHDGICVAIRRKGKCDHLNKDATGAEIRCRSYKAARPQIKGNPVQLGGFHGSE